jgi:hypothetical protein
MARPSGAKTEALLLGTFVAVFALSLAGCSGGRATVTTLPSSTNTRPGTAPAPPSDLSLLPRINIQQSDVPHGDQVLLIPGGGEVAGQVTLDVCGGRYASEALRIARRQVSVTNLGEQNLISTEAVLYRSPAAASSAIAEVRRRVATCPDTFFAEPGPGAVPLRWTFTGAPDSAWPAIPGVQRLALSATEEEQKGERFSQVLVYLRRGAFLLGVYFTSASGPQVAIAGRTSIEGISELLASRMASTLPA